MAVADLGLATINNVYASSVTH
ncbi:hypothetical protein AZE42_11813 [Rhizopogon vesiculosus]|uniref:Uncharacterized protein n=1 Tax=Rhizopogon vesiculosus TaxID=180088 RepID=A0A1J8QDZ4_9AGAM|nr:hypothetical protein AZE42_11813 [Rhizopogon vesiculosus]